MFPPHSSTDIGFICGVSESGGMSLVQAPTETSKRSFQITSPSPKLQPILLRDQLAQCQKILHPTYTRRSVSPAANPIRWASRITTSSGPHLPQRVCLDCLLVSTPSERVTHGQTQSMVTKFWLSRQTLAVPAPPPQTFPPSGACPCHNIITALQQHGREHSASPAAVKTHLAETKSMG